MHNIVFTVRPSQSVRTADCDTIYIIYIFLCTQSGVRTLFERRAVSDFRGKWLSTGSAFMICIISMYIGKPQKKSSLNGRPNKRGGGGGKRDRPLRKKELFWNLFFPTFQNFNGH